jgi:hypothetical protein
MLHKSLQDRIAETYPDVWKALAAEHGPAIKEIESLRSSNPALYQHLTTLGQFTTTTIAKNRLLRPFPHMNALTENSSTDGDVKTHSLEASFQRRFASGFTFNANFTGLYQRDKNFYFNEYDPETSWRESNAAVPRRLAAMGIYGVASYAVSQRERELGIRMALGADQSQLVRMVASQAGKWVAWGALAGLAGAVVLGRLLAGVVFEVSVLDPATFATVTLILVAVAFISNWLPARRATRVDPITTLRAE